MQTLPAVPCVVDEIHRYAGAAIGSAVIRFPTLYAKNFTASMGQAVRIDVGATPIFRGLVGQAPYEITGDQDEFQALLFDDKWWLQRRTIGQPGIGTLNAGVDGFTDVGYDLVFNKGGRPNKLTSDLDFNAGSTAVAWTLKTILQWIFEYYVDATVATLDETLLDTDYDFVPSNVSLTGQTALQAIDTVCQLAGQSWGLKVTSSGSPPVYVSAFVPVLPAAGTVRTVTLFAPKAAGKVTMANEFAASSIRIGSNVSDVRDNFIAVSSPVAKETTLDTLAATPLLVSGNPTNPKYKIRLVVDVTQYAANNLGSNLTAGSKPKPWLSHLLTRPTPAGTGYYTAVQLAADPTLLDADQLGKPILWVSDGTDPDVNPPLLVKGGARIDCEHCTVDFEAVVDVANASDDLTTKLAYTSIERVWLTVATKLETVLTGQAAGDAGLGKSFTQVIPKSDLVPELRETVWLPDLASADRNAHVVISSGAEETYVDVQATLNNTAARALTYAQYVEVPIDIGFPFFPLLELGDRISIVGRASPATGEEVVVEISYRVHESFETHVKATNLIGEMDPEKFTKPV